MGARKVAPTYGRDLHPTDDVMDRVRQIVDQGAHTLFDYARRLEVSMKLIPDPTALTWVAPWSAFTKLGQFA